MKRDRETKGLVQAIRDQAIIIEIVLIETQIRQKGTVELEDKSSVSNAKGGDILMQSVLLLQTLEGGRIITGLYPKTTVSQVARYIQISKKVYLHKLKGSK